MSNLNISEKSAVKYIVLTVLAIIIWVIIGKAIFTQIDKRIKHNLSEGNISGKYQLLSEVIQKLEDEYFREIPSDTLLQAAIDGIMSKFDNYTYYMNGYQLDEFKDDSQGLFYGIGVNVDTINDYITVKSIRESSPASRAGITAGDIITKVDDIDVKGITIEKSSTLIRGDAGTQIKITVRHPNENEDVDLYLKREKIIVPSVPYAFTISNTGYIRISTFNSNTGQEFEESLRKLEYENIEGLIIDLRSNPGGILSQTVKCLDEFIDSGEQIVYTKGRDGKKSSVYLTKDDEYDKKYPIIILINNTSASASEIFAGTIQDYDLGLVIGEKSYGKGSVQQIFPVSTGGVKITTSHYYLKSGRCIQKNAEIDDSTEYYTLHGREVNSGDGIKPDLEVTQLELTDVATELLEKHIYFSFAVDYFSKNSLNVTEDFILSDNIFKEFAAFAKSSIKNINTKEIYKNKSTISYLIKSEFMGLEHGEDFKYKELLTRDQQVQKALSIINNSENKEDIFAMIKQESK